MKTTLILLAMFCSAYASAQKETGFHIDKEYSATNISSILIESNYAVIKVSGSEKQNVRVKIDRVLTSYSPWSGSPDLSLDITEEAGTLRITEKKSLGDAVRKIGYIPAPYKIIIEVPDRLNVNLTGEDNSAFLQNILGQVQLNLEGESYYDVKNCPRIKSSTKKTKGQPNN